MFGKKILLMITYSFRKSVLLGLISVISVALISTLVFTHLSAKQLENRNIIIDPGHGGVDGGTNDNSSFFEKDINLQIAMKLQKVLKSENLNNDSTRVKDISLDGGVPLSQNRHLKDLSARVALFNSGKYDMFISIHVNQSSNSEAIGPIVLYGANFPSSELLAECVQSKLNTCIKSSVNTNTAHNPIKSDYFILRNANIPGILVETGFISNPTEKRLLQDGAYQSKLAKSISEGVKEYYKIVQSSNESDGVKAVPQNSIPQEDIQTPVQEVSAVWLVDLEK